MMFGPNLSKIMSMLSSDDFRDRSIGEYWFVKDKYDKLHRMIVTREAGKLSFSPSCPMEQWKAQAKAMGEYLYQLEVKAAYENVELYDLSDFYEPF